MVKLHSIMLVGKYSSSLPGNSLTSVLVKIGSSSTHSKLMRYFGLRWLLVLVLLPVVGCSYIPQLLGDVMTKTYVITAEMFLERTDSQFNVRPPSFPTIVEL